MKPKTKKLVEAFGFLKLDEADLLMKTADRLEKGAIVVNVGAGAGTSALAIIEQRPDLAASAYTVDHRDDDNPFGGLLNETHAFQNADMLDLKPIGIKGNSSAVGHEWSKPPISLLVIDADHSREGLRKDLAAWMPHLAEGGFVAFHDYEDPRYPAVKELVDEYVLVKDNLKLVEQEGTMILFKKEAVQKKVAPKEKEIEIVETKVEKATEVKDNQIKQPEVAPATKRPYKKKS